MKTWKKNVLILSIFLGMTLAFWGVTALLSAWNIQILIGHVFVPKVYVPWVPTISLILLVGMLVGLLIVNRRRLAPVIVCSVSLALCAFLVAVSGFFSLLGSSIGAGQDVRLHRYEGFDTLIAIDNSSFFFAGYSAIYQSNNGMFFEHIATVDNADGYRVTVSEEGLLYEYLNGEHMVFLRYVDGHFVKEEVPQG